MTEVDHRSAVAWARRVHDALVAGQIDQLPGVQSAVRPTLAPGAERVLAVGAFELATFGPDSAGTGSQSVATPVDLRSVLRAVRGGGDGWASSAAEALGARWRTTHWGRLTVTTHGMYLDHGSAVHPWPWDLLTSVRLAGPGRLQYVARGADGTLPWRLGSPYAELIFVLWAMRCRPDHPQLTSGLWLRPLEAQAGGPEAVDAEGAVDTSPQDLRTDAPAADRGWLPTPEREAAPAEATPAGAASSAATPSEPAQVVVTDVDERINNLLGRNQPSGA